jgi:hypothetical protein
MAAVRDPDLVPPTCEHHNAAIVPLYTVQYAARHRQVGTYLLHEPWTAFVVTSYHNAIHFVIVDCEPGGRIVICADPKRTHGRPYRIRVNRAAVTAIYRVNGLQSMEPVDSFQFAPDGARRSIKVGEIIDYGTGFSSNPAKLQGRGLIVSPTYKEAMKSLAYVLRYNNNRIFQIISQNAATCDNVDNIAGSGDMSVDALNDARADAPDTRELRDSDEESVYDLAGDLLDD